MSRFFYKVKNSEDKIIQNYIEASTITDAAIKLEKQGYIVLEIKEETFHNNYNLKTVTKGSKEDVLKLSEKKEFFSSFFFLFKSGLSVLEIFDSIYNSSKNQRVKLLCSRILHKLEKGYSLKDSMKDSYNLIGIAYAKLIAAGEESGKLDSVLSDIIKNLSREEEIKSNLISSLTYPCFTFMLAIAVGLFFKFFVIKILSSMGSGICQAAIIMLAVAAVVKIAVIFAIMFAGLFYIYKNKKLLNKIVGFIFGIRIFANLLKNYYFVNFFSVLALAYESGISPAESLMLANSVINIPEINKKIKKSENMLKQGCEFTTALNVTGLFSNYAMSQVAAGEKAGELDKSLKTAAYDYENKLNTSISSVLKLVEPLMLIFVGIIVLLIAVNAYKAYFGWLSSLL